MAYNVEMIHDDDLVYIVPRMFAAFGSGYEFVNSLYPNHDTAEGQEKIIGRFQAMKNMAKHVMWTKAVEASSGKAVGMAVWTLIEETKPPETELDGPPGTWPSEAEKQYCQALTRVLVSDRRRVIRENNLPIMCMSGCPGPLSQPRYRLIARCSSKHDGSVFRIPAKRSREGFDGMGTSDSR